MHLKMSSAEVVYCKELPNITDELSIEANSVDTKHTAPTVCHRGFLNMSADEKSSRLLLRLAYQGLLFKLVFAAHRLVLVLLPCNYHFTRSIVHEIKFGDIAVMQILTICSRVTGILILIVSLGCLKEVKTMNMIL